MFKINDLSFRYFKNIDFVLVLSVLALTIIGCVFVYSATHNMANFTKLFSKQLISIFIGFVMIFIFSMIDYNSYYNISKYLYIFANLLLISVLVFGNVVRGAKSWFNLGVFSFQPTELARIISVIMLSFYIDRNIRNKNSFNFLLNGFLIVLPMILLIFLQPDFGGILVLFPVIFGLFYISGIPKIYLNSILFSIFIIVFVPLSRTFIFFQRPDLFQYIHFFYLLCGGLIIFLIVYFILKVLKPHFSKTVFFYCLLLFCFCLSIGELCDRHIKDYQRNRLMVFFNPESDRLGSGYNVIQSKIGVGSGGFLGKGFTNGTQGQLGFLPERHTDFIFSVISEEGGFIMSFFILTLFSLVCYRIYFIAINARDRFGSLIASGFLILFSFFVFLNIGFVIGILPVTGVPLPFISYGGSSFIINSILIGIVLNIGIKRYSN